MNVTFRPAVYGDAPLLARIHCTSWAATYRGLMPEAYLAQWTDPVRREGIWRERLSSGDRETLICLAGGRPAGFFSLAGPDKDLGAAVRELRAIYLLPEWQGQGVGSAAMDFIVPHAREQGYTALSLWVLRENARAVRFYLRHGFMPDGQAKTLAAQAPVFVERYLKTL